MKSVNLSVLPNYVVWFVGVDVEFVLSCRSDPLGRDGDESEQKTLDSVCGLDSISHGDISHGDRHLNDHKNRPRDLDDGNKRTYNGYIGAEDGWFTHNEALPAPDRTPWGIVALKNAASAYTIGNIKIYKQSEFSEKGTNAPVFTTIRSSYNVNEVARKSIPEGTYAITYQAIDPNNGNRVVGNWKYENIEIEQGDSPSSATTEISSINAQEIQ